MKIETHSCDGGGCMLCKMGVPRMVETDQPKHCSGKACVATRVTPPSWPEICACGCRECGVVVHLDAGSTVDSGVVLT